MRLGPNTSEGSWFRAHESASGWEKFEHVQTVGYTPTSRLGLYNTEVKAHAESEYERMASMTSDHTSTTSTSDTWFGYHAKGSGWSDAVDRESGVIGGTSAAGVYYQYATGGGDYLVEMQHLSDGTWQNAWASGSSSGASHVEFAEVARGDRQYLSEESGVFAGQREAGFYRSWSKKNDAIDYVGKDRHHSQTQTELADGTSLTWTYENEVRYTGVGEFRAGEGDSGGFNPDGQTGLWYSGVADTLTTTYANETTFYTATTVPTRTFAYPLGSGTYMYTQPGWSSWTKHRWTVESEATFDAAWISWDRYSPAESVDGFFGEEGEERTDTWTWLSQDSYTGPAGHLFEQHFGSTTTTRHESSTTGVPPTDLAVIAAMTAIAKQSVGQSTSGGTVALCSTGSQGGSGSGGDGGNAAKNLNLAEFFAQAAAPPSHQPASQSAVKCGSTSLGQSAGQAGAPASELANDPASGQGSAPASDESNDPPERHPDSSMPESWLDALDALRDHAKTAHDDPEQLPALTDAAIAELNAMEAPENPGTPIMQAVAPQGVGRGGTSSGGGVYPQFTPPNPNTDPCGYFRWFSMSWEERIFGPFGVGRPSASIAAQPTPIDKRMLAQVSHPETKEELRKVIRVIRGTWIANAGMDVCYRWVEKAARNLRRNACSYWNDEYIIDMVEFSIPPVHGWTGHAALRITFRNGQVFYFDDGVMNNTWRHIPRLVWGQISGSDSLPDTWTVITVRPVGRGWQEHSFVDFPLLWTVIKGWFGQ